MTLFGLRTRTVMVACSVLAAGSAFGYWGYDEYRRHELRAELVTLVEDTSLRLRDALGKEVAITPASHPAMLRRFYDHAEAVDAHLRRLRELDASTASDFAYAAEDYVLTAREILLRRASSHRNRLELAGSAHALRTRMRADDRSGNWVREAVRARERLEEDYRDYRISTDALGSLLETFPLARAKVAAHVDASALADEALAADARDRIAEAARQVADEVAQAGRLAAYR